MAIPARRVDEDVCSALDAVEGVVVVRIGVNPALFPRGPERVVPEPALVDRDPLVFEPYQHLRFKGGRVVAWLREPIDCRHTMGV